MVSPQGRRQARQFASPNSDRAPEIVSDPRRFMGRKKKSAQHHPAGDKIRGTGAERRAQANRRPWAPLAQLQEDEISVHLPLPVPTAFQLVFAVAGTVAYLRGGHWDMSPPPWAPKAPSWGEGAPPTSCTEGAEGAFGAWRTTRKRQNGTWRRYSAHENDIFGTRRLHSEIRPTIGRFYLEGALQHGEQASFRTFEGIFC